MRCVYCDRPLACVSCGADYEPRDRDQYEALSRTEVPIVCPGCGEVLTCRWCRTPYEGRGEDGAGDDLDGA